MAIKRTSWGALLMAAWVIGGGCAADGDSAGTLYQRLQSDDHQTRVAAVVEAARNRDQAALPYLVDRLEDEDVDIRLFSVQALREISGREFGYRYFDDEPARRESVKRWRNWLDERRRAPVSSSKPG